MAQRLDAALFSGGFAVSRTHARRIVEEGRATINGRTARRPSARVCEADAVGVVDVPEGGEWASRAALKLVGALERLDGSYQANSETAVDERRVSVGPAYKLALDVGASTGGFTDVLLRRGVGHVVAVDVGHGQLVERLASDPRVTNLAGTDARDLTADLVGNVDLVVSDVSFISLTHIVPTLANLVPGGTPVLLMVKPQFEVGRQKLPKSGVVTDPRAWHDAVLNVAQCAATNGLRIRGIYPSVLAGQDGNREFFVHFQRARDHNALCPVECEMIERGVQAAALAAASKPSEEGVA